MQVIYTNEDMPLTFSKSIFLAGGSLRPGQEKEMTSWRNDALQILQDIGYDGVVFCPENRGGKFDKDFSYDDQIKWEETYLNVADIILFWVPRDLSLDSNDQLKMACLTTNIEWGAWADSGKVVLGAPEDAEKVSYLKYYAEKYNVLFSETLTQTLRHAVDKLGDGAKRSGGERYVPLFIWQLSSFQAWYQAQKNAGNILEDARLLYTFRPSFKDFVFLWILQVNVYVSSENRYKKNEVVISRPDISCVMLWHKDAGDHIEWTEVVLVREFRSPASTVDGFIYELPSGSVKNGDADDAVAVEELQEETGFYLKPSRLKTVAVRQLAGTFSAHKAHLYSAELTEEEAQWFKSQKDIPHGVEKDSERTFVEVKTIREIMEEKLVDWSSLGMIFSVLSS